MKKPTTQPIDPIIDQLLAIGLKKTAESLENLYNSPEFLNLDRVELISRLVEPEYTTTTNRQ